MKVTLNPVFESMRGNLDGIVYYTCHGKVRARLYAVPRDPRTVSQRACRDAFAHAIRAWRELSSDEKNYWMALGRRKKISGYNAFISAYLKEKGARTVKPASSAPKQEAYAGSSVPVNALPAYTQCTGTLESTSFPIHSSSSIAPVTVRSCSMHGA
jgi:hypothetical protein